MKPFLGIDVTENKDSTVINGEEFLVIRAESAETPESRASKKKDPEKYTDPLPVGWRAVRIISGAFTIAFLVLVVRWYMAGTNKIYYTYAQYPWIFWLGGAAVAIWLALNIAGGFIESKKATDKALEKQEEAMPNEEEIETISLDLPKDAQDVDLLAFNYVIEDGEIKPVMADDESVSEYFNCSMKLYADEKSIYLASLDEKYAIDLSSLVAIRTVDGEIAIPDWNKDTPPTKGEYKQYGITIDNLNRVIVRSYHILELDRDGEKWGIYFPAYELPAFEKITGLSAK